MKNLLLFAERPSLKRLSPYLLCLGFLWLTDHPIKTSAQTLPPPPTIKVPSRPPTAAPPPPTSTHETTPQPVEVPVSTPTSSSQPAPVREFTFQAPSGSQPSSQPVSVPASPNNQPSIRPSTPTDANFYRVEVSASDEDILEKVKAIEPFAFWQREQQIVYAGRFHQKDQAQQRVQELTQQGLSAQIVPVVQ
ncbi:MAG: hypothetical protein AB4058_10220 [Microcystaceae cyanobacterium]